MTATIRELIQHFTDLWWESDTNLPDLGPVYTPKEQAVREKQLEHFLKQVNSEIANPPPDREAVQALQNRLGISFRQFAQETIGITAQHLDMLPSDDFSAAAQDFIQKARAFDPDLSGEDIYQAGRNAWTANGLQWLLGAPVECSPSIFAYSMLYPYTDNYLDDAFISTSTKLAFNERFRQRLMGERIAPVNNHERIIFQLVGMIEQQYTRFSYPGVFESLLDIHDGQTKSLRLVRPNAAPGEVDVLGISIEKGGTSVMTDGYLINGKLSPAQRLFSFGHGVFAQLLDDLEDVQEDYAAGRLTIYSQAAGHWPLDALTNRTFHFGHKVLERLDCFQIAEPVKDLIRSGATSILIETASRAEGYYTPAYLRELETHSPFRFSFLAKQRKAFARRNGSVVKLIEAFVSRNLEDQNILLGELLPGVR
jgi:hypothetical protein